MIVYEFGRCIMKRKKYFLIICIICLGLLLLAFIFLSDWNEDEDNPLLPIDKLAEQWRGKQDLPSSGETKEIIVPGFKTLVFMADTTKQDVNLYNPEDNDCLFKLTLLADEKELWKSGFIKPGDGYYNIELSEPLKAGEYSGKLQYQCYKEDGAQLNGAVVTFNLIVKEK
jgi:hypothetical protein